MQTLIVNCVHIVIFSIHTSESGKSKKVLDHFTSVINQKLKFSQNILLQMRAVYCEIIFVQEMKKERIILVLLSEFLKQYMQNFTEINQ